MEHNQAFADPENPITTNFLSAICNLKHKTSAFRWAEQNFEAIRWQCTINNAIVKNKMKTENQFKYESI